MKYENRAVHPSKAKKIALGREKHMWVALKQGKAWHFERIRKSVNHTCSIGNDVLSKANKLARF